MRTHLYYRLQNFNARIDNEYKAGWGTAVLLMDGAHRFTGGPTSEAAIVN